MVQDLRSFLEKFEQLFPREVLRIDRELNPEYEPSAVIMELERDRRYPVVFFENIRGSAFPVVANVLATRQRLALALGARPENAAEVFAERIKSAVPPQRIPEAPFQKNRLDGAALNLSTFPILTHFPVDAGPYVTAGLVMARDPESGVDTCGYHRMQLKGADKLGVSLHSRQRLWEYLRRAEQAGRNLEAAVVIGVHPALALGSMALIPYDQGKFDRIGGLLGAPLQVTPCRDIDLDVPTGAEIVIEGEILANCHEPEGPFAEFTDYASYRSTENVFRAKSIHYRDQALYQSITPARSADHVTIVAVHREGELRRALHQTLPNVRQVHAPLSACGLFHCYLALEKTAEGQPMQAILAALAVDHNIKLVIVVDADIDVFDEARVLWAVATRVQADRDVLIIPQHQGMGCTLDPSSDDLSRSAKMGIDATKPLSGFARGIDPDPAAQAKARQLLQEIGTS
ncbi:MAG: UbiD family decarboxylase [Deltaproteobacteria bacterium]|nr:UbiD family decarboxylase [Deltaproteobacteria bacterium]